MEYKYGKTSTDRLNTCDPRLIIIAQKALSRGLMDLSVLEGIRPKERQNLFYSNKKSKVKWPFSKHNVKVPGDKSKAFNIGPYINGKVSYNYCHCCYMAGIILSVAGSLKIKLRWGGNWDMDGEPVTDQDFQDLVHFELVD